MAVTPANAFSVELLGAVAAARDDGDTSALEALAELLNIYTLQMNALLTVLRKACKRSDWPEQFLLEERANFLSFPLSCSPKYIDELLQYTNITLAHPEFHAVKQ